MNTKLDHPSPPVIGKSTLLAFVRTMIGTGRGREGDEDPLPPGPWDPVIRSALSKVQVHGHGSLQPRTVRSVLGPQPEPWKLALAGILARHPEIFDAVGDAHGPGDEVALNPQPLPPRYAFLLAVAQALVTRTELLQELVDAATRKGEQQGIIIVSGYVARFTDDFCGNGFRLRWPLPGPRPYWFTRELDAIDLVVMSTRFELAAQQAFSQDLRRSLAEAGSRFAEAGLSKLQ